MEQKKRMHIRGFREVIELLSTSQRPVVVHNLLTDFAFIHSKFLGPLPMSMDEFRSSLFLDFPHILEVNHLMKQIRPFNKSNNVPSAISYLDSRFFAPLDTDIPHRRESNNIDIHGHNVLRICQLFAKLCSILKIPLDVPEGGHTQLSSPLLHHYNAFSLCSSSSIDTIHQNVGIWKGDSRIVSVDNLVFLWGFQSGICARDLKDLLSNAHDLFSEDFDVRMVDETCAVVVFWNPGFSEQFLKTLHSGENISGKLKDMLAEGLNGAGYTTYIRACSSGLWNPVLAECLDQVMEETGIVSGVSSHLGQSITLGYGDDMIYLEDL